MRRTLLALAALVAVAACSSTGASRVGIVTPPDKYINFDPSQQAGGLDGPVGFRVFNANGTAAWDKYGTGLNAWSPAGLYSSGLPVIGMHTAVIDFSQTNASVPFIQNPPAGYYAIGSLLYVEMATGAGTTSTSPTIKCGNNSGQSNFVSSTTPSTTNVNAAITAGAPSLFILTPATGAAAATLVDLATPITCNVTGGSGTGGWALTGRITAVAALVSPEP